MSGGLGGGSDGSFDADDLSEIRERFKEVYLSSQLKFDFLVLYNLHSFFLLFVLYMFISFLSVSRLSKILKYISLSCRI